MSLLTYHWAALLELWEKRRQQYEQCLNLHLFYRDSEQVDSWMSRQEVTQGLSEYPEAISPAPHSLLSASSPPLQFTWELEGEPQGREKIDPLCKALEIPSWINAQEKYLNTNHRGFKLLWTCGKINIQLLRDRWKKNVMSEAGLTRDFLVELSGPLEDLRTQNHD